MGWANLFLYFYIYQADENVDEARFEVNIFVC